MFCYKCGTQIPDDSTFCASCGAKVSGGLQQPSTPATAPPASPPTQYQPPATSNKPLSDMVTPSTGKSPGLMAVLSFFIPGLGQIILGQVNKGIVVFLILCGWIFMHNIGAVGSAAFYLLNMAYAIASAFDAYSIGKKLNSGQPVGKWEWF
jgi:TM2 domain-containing membrane protein YozV